MTYGVTKSFVVQNIETFKEFWKSEINSFCEYLSDNSVELELVTVFNEIANILNFYTTIWKRKIYAYLKK